MIGRILRCIAASVLGLAVLAPLSANIADAEETSSASLQLWIDQAEEGSAVQIPAGSYQGPIRITKPIRLLADPSADVVLRNNSEQPAVTIEADDVSISGIRIEDETVKEAPSVLVTGDRVQLANLHIVTGADGIKLEDAQEGEVRDSVVEWGAAHITSFTEKGNGIDLYQSHGARITGNTLRGVFDGIYMELSDDTYVSGNHIELSRYGIHCMYTNRTVIRDNTGSLNITGAMIMAVRDVEMTDNTFTKQNENVNSQGILLFDAHESTVANNVVEGNRVGLYVEYSTDNMLENNAVSNNFIGIQLLESGQNTITGNLFTGNVTDAMARGNSDNEIRGNFWDSFSGIDADGDGRSDTAYAINPFFQGLIQKKPAFQLFFQAPGIMFLESLYESGRADWTTDAAPLMQPPAVWTGGTSGGSGMVAGVCSIILTAAALAAILLFRRKMI